MTTAHHVTIDIADFAVAISSTDATFIERQRQRYAEFLAPQAEPRIVIETELIPGVLFVEPRPGPWHIDSEIGPERLRFESYQEKGEVDLRTGRGVLQLDPQAHVENFLRVIYAWLCVENDALLLHGAGIIRDDLGYVFFGPSGAGKTTTSRLASRQGLVLSDDLVIIREHADGFKLHGVPFKGTLSEAPRANQTAPLRGIFRLRQDRQHFVTPLSTITATAELVGASPFVVREKRLSGQLIGVCNHIARSVPMQSLHFRRDDGFWQVIDEYFTDLSQTASTNGR